jgi:hypothetical protein
MSVSLYDGIHIEIRKICETAPLCVFSLDNEYKRCRPFPLSFVTERL